MKIPDGLSKSRNTFGSGSVADQKIYAKPCLQVPQFLVRSEESNTVTNAATILLCCLMLQVNISFALPHYCCTPCAVELGTSRVVLSCPAHPKATQSSQGAIICMCRQARRGNNAMSMRGYANTNGKESARLQHGQKIAADVDVKNKRHHCEEVSCFESQRSIPIKWSVDSTGL
eukprot:3480722-Amphidinium_carterae.1